MGLFLSKERPIGEMNTPYFFFDNRENLPNWFIENLKRIPKNQFVYVATKAIKPFKLSRRPNIFFIHLDLLDYQKSFNEFKGIYRHMSTHGEAFELSCFERYFALQSCMKRFHLENVWHLDTDVVPTPNLKNYQSQNLIFSSPYDDLSVASGHTCKFTAVALNNFLDFLKWEFYQKNYPELKDAFDRRLKDGLKGGVTDMSALAYWLRTLSATAWLNSYGKVFNDVQINHTFSNLHREIDGKKKSTNKFLLVLRINNRIILFKRSGKSKLASLHFQGQYKVLMVPFFRFFHIFGTSNFIFMQTRVLMKIKIEFKKFKDR
jgi:hypothetical protein